LALLGRKLRILGLSHSGAKDVEATDILVLRRDAAEGLIQPLRISTSELRNRVHTEDLKIPQHGRADRNQIREFARV
jgi:hypothetical protein